MSDALQKVFGGSTSKSKPVDVTAPDLAALRGTATAAAGQLISQQGNPYQGPLVAPLTDAEQQILGLLQQDALGASGRQNLLADTLRGKFLPGQEGANPFLQATIEAAQRPTLEALDRTLSRTLPGVFTQAGQFTQYDPNAQQAGGSSAFVRAAGEEANKAARTIADIATNISYQGYESERDRQTQAISLSQEEVNTAINTLGAVGLPRLIEDLGIERGIQVHNDAVNRLIASFQAASGLSGLQTIGTEQENKQYAGIVPGLTGAAKALTGTALGGHIGLGT